MVKKYIYKYKNLILIIISSLILTSIYKQFKWSELQEIIKQANSFSLLLAFSISIFLGYVSSIRYTYFSSIILPNKYPKIKTSTKSYFIASCINLVLPSKIGDLGKGYIAQKLDNKNYPESLHLFTLYEKVSDLFALISIGLIVSIIRFSINYFPLISQNIKISKQTNFLFLLTNLLIFIILIFFLAPLNKKNITNSSGKISTTIYKIVNFSKRFTWKEFYKFQIFSILIWGIHIFQMLLFANSIGIGLWNISGVFILIFSILIGLLPFSFAGIGTRDATIVYFLSPLFGNTKPLFLGILLTSRYLIPAIFGLFFLREIKFNK